MIEETLKRKNDLLENSKTLKELIEKGEFIRFVNVFTKKDYIKISYKGEDVVIHLDWNTESVDNLMNLKPLDLQVVSGVVVIKLGGSYER